MISHPLIIGIAGLVAIAVGWALALGDVPPLRLTIPYLIGSALLTIYSLMSWDFVFLILNGAATVLSALNLVRGIRKLKVRPKNHGKGH
ncbi:MAG: hypothetical protein L7G98_02955 [Vulcanisaeta sp.]|nr:hypothetical protein [Vulcanisaeta sp.]MCG2886896.1 hypothetical protein [Vulcanisaeta sp.]